MNKIKKLLSIVLVLILCLVVSVGSAACDLSKIKAPDIGSASQTEDVGGGKTDDGQGESDETGGGENHDTEGGEQGESQTEIPAGTETAPDNVRFYQYLEKFSANTMPKNVSIESLEMLAAYIEYADFYIVKDNVQLSLKYASNFNEEFEKAQTLSEGRENLNFSQSISRADTTGSLGSYRITESGGDPLTLATETLDKEKNHVLPQSVYALRMAEINSRAADYDGFKLNARTKILPEIQSSEQLRWAIQNGYKPQCVANSPAEKVLNKAKTVLRKIISDDMDDITKLRAIYEWLAFNVQYDNYAAQELSAGHLENASLYDSWYAEGVFNNGKAVCEGYAKSLIIMAGLEGIPAIFLTGNGHAWNRVLIDGKWYVVDATHADVQVGGKETFTYNQFMITDAEKTNRHYTADNYKDSAANTEFNLYETLKFNYEDQEYDLVIESAAELKTVLQYAKSLNPVIGANGCTVDVFVKSSDKTAMRLWKERLDVLPLYDSMLEPTEDVNGNEYYTFYLK